MKKYLFTFAMILCGLAAVASYGEEEKPKSSTEEISPFNMMDYRWKNRLIVVFAEKEEAKIWKNTQSQFEKLSKEIKDRDMKLIGIFPDRILNQKGANIGTEKEAVELRKRFRVSGSGSFLLLIGKDGQEKYRTRTEISLEEVIFPRVDAMPMRQAEIRRRQSNSE